MKRFFNWLKRLFFPPPGSSRFRRILPFVILTIVILGLTVGSASAWEYSNTTQFCGTTCHTMPPQYVTHSISSHARVTCEDCHLGRAPLNEQIVRKYEYSKQTGLAMVFNTYEYPIRAKNMRPARDVCETCHFPEQFSNDTLVELKHFEPDVENTLNYTYLILKTGGGSSREGLGYGIHWHIENPVQYIAVDPERQAIPYVRVVNADGTFTEYVDIEAGFDKGSLDESQLQTMDCITCHNRTSHEIPNPDDAIDAMLGRGEISPEIPLIKQKAFEVLMVDYETVEAAYAGIEALDGFYKTEYSDFASENPELIASAIRALKKQYDESVFPEQEITWGTHPDNSQHKDSPGCFRCHDGKHLSEENEAVRLECNLCHSIPVVSSSQEFLTNIQISRGIEPESHKNSNWISLHREYFDNSCSSCHTTDDPGGISNTSFCSNSGCHSTEWEFAGFDAPGLRAVLSEELKQYVTPKPKFDELSEATPAPSTGSPTGFASIQGLLTKCTGCHGDGGMKGLDLRTYESLMTGGDSGPAVVPGDPEASSLVQVQSGDSPHFGQFTDAELEKIIAWITAGAEK